MRKLPVLFICALVMLTARASDTFRMPMGPSLPVESEKLLPDAKWIAGTESVPDEDSLFYLDNPAPLLKTNFDIPADIQKAEMRITAAGYYETWLNGVRIGDQQLDPAWTDFSKRVYVTTIDVTGKINKGSNIWGIMLGNGFYNPLPLKMWGGRNIRKDMPVGQPCTIASLVITFRNGRKMVVSTSEQWITRPGPVTRNNVYLGEWYDARREVQDWTRSMADTKSWKPVKVVEGPGGETISAFFPPVKINKWLAPVAVSGTNPEKQIIDFGQNFAGIIRIRIQAKQGDTIRFRYGELLYPDGSLNPMTAVCGQIKKAGAGGPGAPDIAEQTDVYVSRGGQGEVFQPSFTFHGFRFVEITGLRDRIELDDIQGGVMNTAVNLSGEIHSSSDYLNILNSNCQWTFLSNLQSVQSDCPAREKFGYGGDINATAEAYIYNFDMRNIYRKIIYDWMDAMRSDGFVDTAPFVGIAYCGLSWESAFLFLQNSIWNHYGDSSLVRELYQADKEWMKKIARKHPLLIVDDGLSDHESLSKVPVELTGTCHYYQCARIMARFAEIMDDKNGAEQYGKLANEIRVKVLDLFWDTPVIEVPNKQTLLSTLLSSGILEGEDKKRALARLLDVLDEADYHVSTGIFGTQALLEALASNNHTDIAFRIVNQSGYPGWKHMIDQGATTLWETWKQSDNTFSQNHPMFGSVSEWYHKWLGGIQPDPENPGQSHVLLKPRPVRGISSVNSARNLDHGKLFTSWRWIDEKVRLTVTVPADVQVLWIPAPDCGSIQVVQAPTGWDEAKLNGQNNGVRLGAQGSYVFEFKGPAL